MTAFSLAGLREHRPLLSVLNPAPNEVHARECESRERATWRYSNTAVDRDRQVICVEDIACHAVSEPQQKLDKGVMVYTDAVLASIGIPMVC